MVPLLKWGPHNRIKEQLFGPIVLKCPRGPFYEIKELCQKQMVPLLKWGPHNRIKEQLFGPIVLKCPRGGGSPL